MYAAIRAVMLDDLADEFARADTWVTTDDPDRARFDMGVLACVLERDWHDWLTRVVLDAAAIAADRLRASDAPLVADGLVLWALEDRP
jgi:hypothetical protein